MAERCRYCSARSGTCDCYDTDPAALLDRIAKLEQTVDALIDFVGADHMQSAGEHVA